MFPSRIDSLLILKYRMRSILLFFHDTCDNTSKQTQNQFVNSFDNNSQLRLIKNEIKKTV